MIFTCGDIHGAWDMLKCYQLETYLRKSGILKDCRERGELIYLICTGDFGLVWDKPIKISKKLDKYNFYISAKDQANIRGSVGKFPYVMLFLDGNHENHDVLDSLPVHERWGGAVHQVSEKVYHLMRGEHYTIDGVTFLTIGGGLSVDKARRTEGESWWPQETISKEQGDKALEVLKTHDNTVDYVLSHTCPAEVLARLEAEVLPEYDKFSWGPKAEDPSTVQLSRILNVANFKAWMFGHFHVDHEVDLAGNHFYCQMNHVIKLPEAGSNELPTVIDLETELRRLNKSEVTV